MLDFRRLLKRLPAEVTKAIRASDSDAGVLSLAEFLRSLPAPPEDIEYLLCEDKSIKKAVAHFARKQQYERSQRIIDSIDSFRVKFHLSEETARIAHSKGDLADCHKLLRRVLDQLASVNAYYPWRLAVLISLSITSIEMGNALLAADCLLAADIRLVPVGSVVMVAELLFEQGDRHRCQQLHEALFRQAEIDNREEGAETIWDDFPDDQTLTVPTSSQNLTPLDRAILQSYVLRVSKEQISLQVGEPTELVLGRVRRMVTICRAESQAGNPVDLLTLAVREKLLSIKERFHTIQHRWQRINFLTAAHPPDTDESYVTCHRLLRAFFRDDFGPLALDIITSPGLNRDTPNPPLELYDLEPGQSLLECVTGTSDVVEGGKRIIVWVAKAVQFHQHSSSENGSLQDAARPYDHSFCQLFEDWLLQLINSTIAYDRMHEVVGWVAAAIDSIEPANIADKPITQPEQLNSDLPANSIPHAGVSPQSIVQSVSPENSQSVKKVLRMIPAALRAGVSVRTLSRRIKDEVLNAPKKGQCREFTLSDLDKIREETSE